MKDLLQKVVSLPIRIKRFVEYHRTEKIQDTLRDDRPYKERELDYINGLDIVLTAKGENKRITKLPIQYYNQGSSSACGAHAAAHGRLLTEGNKTNPFDWYRLRTNYSGPGMYLKDVLKLKAEADVTEPLSSSLRLTEAQANATQYKDLFNKRQEKYDYYTIHYYDGDEVWSAVSNGLATTVSLYATGSEYTDEPRVLDWGLTLSWAPIRHFVEAIPYSNHTIDGVRYISVVDSSPFGGHTLRHISIDFLNERMYLGGGYYIKRGAPRKRTPKELPIEKVEMFNRGDDVTVLQQFLNAEGLQESKHITGYYGPITARNVMEWQLRNVNEMKGYTAKELADLRGEYWGPASIKAVKKIYG